MNKLVVYGAGGHAKVVAEIAELNDYSNISFYEPQRAKDKLIGYQVVQAFDESEPVLIAIGNNAVRKKYAQSLPNKFVKITHPGSNVSTRAQVGEGTIIAAGVTVNSEAIIGKHCIINTNASVDHDCLVGDYVHLSPNVALAGNVKVGEGSHIGIGGCVIPGIEIGKWCTIGAGAVVIRDVPDGATVAGNPARVIKLNEKQSKYL